MSMEKLILVDEGDAVIGEMEKLEAHQKGLLHRAFSVFIFNRKGETLLQKRAHSKYHSAGLWSNACCGHPRPGETTLDAAERRLNEEMGIKCQLTETGAFTYKVNLDHSLVENEVDHVFVGFYEGLIDPNPEEVQDYRWESLNTLSSNVHNNPHEYSEWLRIILDKHLNLLTLANEDFS